MFSVAVFALAKHFICNSKRECYARLWVYVAPRLRGPEHPVYQRRDQVFWHTALLDIELNSFLLMKIGVHEVYYNASGDTACSSG